jgi:adenine-specific DNA-methyltransferase
MRYIGSKATTLPLLAQEIGRHIPSGELCDPFGGIASVGSHFKRLGYRVHTGDLLTFAYHFQVSKVVLNELPSFSILVKKLGLHNADEVFVHLQHLPFVRSWVHREYAERRRYFTSNNAARIDAVRREVWRWQRAGWLTAAELSYLLSCLIDAADRVANTAGTYYAYLKQWSRKATQPFRLSPIPVTAGLQGCTASLIEANDLVRLRHYDVLYLDPPHNDRDYAAYYHFPETLATGRRPRPLGRSGVDAATRPRSPYVRPRQALSALRALLDCADYSLLVVHYSDAGLITPNEMVDLLGPRGNLQQLVLPALGYTSSHTSRITRHRLYMILP